MHFPGGMYFPPQPMTPTILHHRLGLGDFVSDLQNEGGAAVSFIQDKAKQGAESAIPDIQAQVAATVKPYVYAALLLGFGGLLFGIAAYKRSHRPASLSGTKTTNEYGLTFYRWWRAAGFSSERKVPTAAYDAWLRGEDPSDWRKENTR